MRSTFRPRFPMALLGAVIVLVATVAVVGANEPTSQIVRLHGFLSDRGDHGSIQPADGTFSMSFELFDAPLRGEPVASFGPVAVEVIDGRYFVALEFDAADFAEADRYVAISVDGEPISPLALIVSSPFGYFSEHVDGPEPGPNLPASAAATSRETSVDGPQSSDFEDVEGRYLDWLALHTDDGGFLRPDLWRKAVEDTEQMEVAAWMPSSERGIGGVTGVQWVQQGPEPLIIDKEQVYQGSGPDSGEVLDVAVDPRNSTDTIIYIATNQGGIWKSTDGGDTWEPKTDFMPSLSMGAVSLHPDNPSVVYAGTGNLFDGGGVVQLLTKAVGIYRSVDAGETWSVLNPGGIFSNNGIHRIVFPPADGADPAGADVVLVATRNGLYRSVDGGQNFGNNPPSFDNSARIVIGFITDLKLDTTAAGTVHAAVRSQGIFRSTDSGRSFPTNLFTTTNGAPDPTTDLRFIWFDQSTMPDNQTLYAAVQGPDPGAGDPCRRGGNFVLTKTTDGGATWNPLPQGNARATDNCCQCGYDQTVGVDPVDPDRVYIAFQEMFCSDDGGATFPTPACTRDLTHWDHHAITFSPPSHRTPGDTTTRIWTGTDGGVHYSNDGGSSWANKNETISTNILFHMDMGRGSSTNNAYIYGGCQDTGTIHTRPAYGKRWHLSIDGDGQGVAVDPSDPEKAYGGGNNGYFKTTDGGDNWTSSAGPPPGSFRQIVDRNDGSNVYVTTGSDLYQSTDTGDNFTLIRSSGTGANMRAMDITAIDSNTMWIGLTDGTLEYTEDLLAGASSTWTSVTVPGSPNQTVIGVAIDPLNTDQVVAVYPGYCGGACAAGNRTRHVFLTTDKGQTWTDISGTDGGGTTGDLPDLPVMSVVIDPDTSPHSIIVSTITGVMRSSDLGATWFKLGVGLPNTQARTLQIDPSVDPTVLRIGTYGRSVFSLESAEGPLLSVNGDLGFGPVCVGSVSQRTVQMFNVGSEDLNINSFFRLSGSPDFEIVSGPPTPVTILPGHELDWTIRYQPTTEGDAQATFQINSNDQFEPSRTLSASGTGSAASIAAAIADTGSFGDVCQGDFRDLDLTIANAGGCELTVTGISSSEPGEFQVPDVVSFPLVIGAGDSIRVPIRFEAIDLGPASATISVTSDDPDTPTLNIPVRANVPVGDLQVAIADSGDFGEVCSGDFGDLDLILFNQGSCAFAILSITASDPQFVLPSDTTFPLVLSPDAEFTMPLRFQPDACGAAPILANLTVVVEKDIFADGFESGDLSAWGAKTAAVAIDTVLELSGFAPCPDINVAIADSGNFGRVCKGDHTDLDLTLFNQGRCDLTISNLELLPDPDSFVLPANLTLPLVLSHDADFTLPLRFSPDSCFDTPESRTLEITSDDPDETTLGIDLTAVSPCPNLVIDPAGVSDLFAFPPTVVDTTTTLGCFSEQGVVLRNNAECPLIIDDISAVAADFSVTAPSIFPVLLPGGEETLDVTVRFTPQADADPHAPGEVTGLLTVLSDDPDGAQQADLCGESVAQSGVRFLVTDVSSGTPVPIDGVDAITISSTGLNTSGPIYLRYTDQPVSAAEVCGRTILYHIDEETLPTVATTGDNPLSSYDAKAKEGSIKTTHSFELGQCELREFQLQLLD